MITFATAVKWGDRILKLAFGAVMVVGAVVLVAMIAMTVNHAQGGNIALLNPQGLLAARERDLMGIALGLMLVVVVPVYILTFVIAWRYRAGNHRAAYKPDWDHNRWLETAWWGFPCAIILALSVVTWQSTHALDPYKPLAAEAAPIKIQVVAMQWKWLFIYPDENIATLNYVRIPQGVPVQFEITSDAPMNSFWIPQLAGQVYAMPGMSTQLHVLADNPGEYQGSSANLSGSGFAGMRFAAQVATRDDYAAWLRQVKKAGQELDLADYEALAAPSKNQPAADYGRVIANLYDQVIAKFMGPEHHMTTMGTDATGAYAQ